VRAFKGTEKQDLSGDWNQAQIIENKELSYRKGLLFILKVHCQESSIKPVSASSQL
jgi:hypothetical protein